MIVFECGCGCRYQLKDSASGKQLVCKTCQSEHWITDVADDPSAFESGSREVPGVRDPLEDVFLAAMARPPRSYGEATLVEVLTRIVEHLFRMAGLFLLFIGMVLVFVTVIALLQGGPARLRSVMSVGFLLMSLATAWLTRDGQRQQAREARALRIKTLKIKIDA